MYTLPRGVGVGFFWVLMSVNGVVCVTRHGEGRAVLSGGWDEAQLRA